MGPRNLGNGVVAGSDGDKIIKAADCVEIGKLDFRGPFSGHLHGGSISNVTEMLQRGVNCRHIFFQSLPANLLVELVSYIISGTSGQMESRRIRKYASRERRFDPSVQVVSKPSHLRELSHFLQLGSQRGIKNCNRFDLKETG